MSNSTTGGTQLGGPPKPTGTTLGTTLGGTKLGGPKPAGTTLGQVTKPGTSLGQPQNPATQPASPNQSDQPPKPKAKKKKKPKTGPAPPKDPSSYIVPTFRASDNLDLSSDEEEDQEDYRKGGYHPVTIGTTFRNKYKVTAKLGWGHFSTVWLCKNLEDDSEIALKIVKSAPTYKDAALDEIKILNVLALQNTKQSCVLNLIDHFTISGIHGSHIAMAFEKLGCNLLSLIRIYKYRGIPVPLVRMITKQLLVGLSHIHRCQIIHTDLKPENILMIKTPQILKRLSKEQIDEIKQAENEKDSDVRDDEEKEVKKDEEKKVDDKSQPDQTQPDQPPSAEPTVRKKKAIKPPIWNDDELKDIFANDHSYRIKIVDLGNACWVHKHFTDDVQTREYRAPEIIINSSYGPPIDVWSVACIVFELLTGDQLFKPKSGRSYGKSDDHLALMIELLGRPKISLLLQGKKSSDYFNRKGELRQIKSLKFWGLKDVLLDKYHYDPVTTDQVCSFLLPMLQFDSRDRATAEQCLAHPWIKDIDIDNFESVLAPI